MSIGWIFFGIFFFCIFILFILMFFKNASYFHLAFRNFTKRPKTTALAMTGLVIGSTIISGSLILGDSMEHMVREITIDNLGELDITITSPTYFDYEIYETLADNEELSGLIDRLSAAITVYGSIINEDEKNIIPKIRVIGYDNTSSSFGGFKTKDILKLF